MFTSQPVRAFSDNYIWLLRGQNSQAVVVDPGEAAPVIAALDAQALTLAGIMLTHHHFDHVGGVAQLLARWQCPVYGPHNPAIENISQHLGAGEQVTILDSTFTILEVPGHTLDHIAYFLPGDSPLLFCGDTLFAGGCGRVFEGTFPMMHESLQRLAALPEGTRVYCAHEYTLANLAFALAVEPDNKALQKRVAAARALREQEQPTVPSVLADEKATNPFLRCDASGVQAGLRDAGLEPAADAAGRFAQLRQWKDNF